VDSLDAQVASYYVAEHYPLETWLTFDWAVFDALWQDERDIGDVEVLAELAEASGVDPDGSAAAVGHRRRQACPQKRIRLRLRFGP
jgi:predicted DsbA family dithiol-disulfide isomerase